MRQELEIKTEVKDYRYIEKIRELGKYYQPTLFSSNSFYFSPTKNDWKIIRKHIPTILLYITNNCNSSCKICFKNSLPGDNSQDFSMKEISCILKKIGRGKRVVLIGGEPTVRKDLFKIIKLIKKSGNYPELFTNGLRLANVRFVKKLKDLGVKRVYFSFDGFDKEIYEKMSGNKNELILKLLALNNLEAFGIDVILSVRIVKGLNEDQVKKIIDFCVKDIKRSGTIRGIDFYGATPYGRFLIENGEFSEVKLIKLLEKVTRKIVSLEYLVETKKLVLNINKILSKLGISINFGSGGLIGFFEVGSIKRLIPIRNLKKINGLFERNKIFQAIFELLKIKKLRAAILKFIFKRNVLDNLKIPGLFFIMLGNVDTPLVRQDFMMDSLGFEKNPRLKINVVRSTRGYSAPETT